MCADIAFHDMNTHNPHAHIMLTMRLINLDGTWGQKSKQEGKRKIPTTDWNDQTNAELWRKGWAVAVNAELERHKHTERIDHRSYERQGIDKIPTMHLAFPFHKWRKRNSAKTGAISIGELKSEINNYGKSKPDCTRYRKRFL